MSILIFLAMIAIVCLFAFDFLWLGLIFLTKLKLTNEHKDKYLVASASFFVGMAVFLSTLRLISRVTNNYILSFWMVFALSVIVLFANRDVGKSFLKKLGIIKISGIAILFTAFTALFRLILFHIPKSGIITSITSIGTLHSSRYVNLITYILGHNYIPLVNQSYGQSLLASFPCMFGMNYSSLALTLWLALSLFFMALLLFGIFRSLNIKGIWLYISIILVMLGNMSLSITHILVIDSGSPFYLSGYTDSIAGVCSFVIFWGYINHIFVNEHKASWYNSLFIIFTMIYWGMSAPQNIVITGGLLTFGFIYLSIKKDFTYIKKYLWFLIFCLLGLGLSILQGGMLTISSLVENANIAGMMSVSKSFKLRTFTIMPYHLQQLGQWSWDLPHMKSIMDKSAEYMRNSNIELWAYYFSLLLLDSLRIVFWPLLGITITRNFSLKNPGNSKLNCWSWQFVFTFIIGYCIAFIFKISDYKWELARFMIPSYFIGMILTAYWLYNSSRKSKLSNILTLSCVILIVAGPLIYFTPQLITNLLDKDIVTLICNTITFKNQYIK